MHASQPQEISSLIERQKKPLHFRVNSLAHNLVCAVDALDSSDKLEKTVHKYNQQTVQYAGEFIDYSYWK